MSLLLHIPGLEQLHHAYGISPHTASRDVISFLETLLGVKYEGQPDIWVHETDQLTIDDARLIKEKTIAKPLVLDRTLIIVAAKAITTEAQHALLKVLEEPTAHSHIFLCIPTIEMVLPTVRSRLYHIQLEAAAPTKKTKLNPETFLASGPGERIASVKSLLEKKDHEQIAAFLGGIEKILGAHKNEKTVSALQTLYMVRDYIRDRGSSPKLLIEHLATVLPVVQSKHV